MQRLALGFASANPAETAYRCIVPVIRPLYSSKRMAQNAITKRTVCELNVAHVYLSQVGRFDRFYTVYLHVLDAIKHHVKFNQQLMNGKEKFNFLYDIHEIFIISSN